MDAFSAFHSPNGYLMILKIQAEDFEFRILGIMLLVMI